MAFKYRGKTYEKATEVREARRMQALDDIKNKRGIKGFVSNLIMNKKQRAKLDGNGWTQW